MKEAVRRTWTHLFEERLGRRRQTIPMNRRFWPLADDERGAVEELVAQDHVRELVSLPASRANDSRVKFVDAAFWVKGCSSLGLWRAAVLVQIKDRTKKDRKRHSLSLIDIKQAVDPIAPWQDKGATKLLPAERVLHGAQALAPALGKRMIAASLLDRSVFVRELLPQDLKVELDRISADQARAVAFYLGMVLGNAHGRQLDASKRRLWRDEMTRHRSKRLDAPIWLWQSIVKLVAVHEEAYLEHCQRYALGSARLSRVPRR